MGWIEVKVYRERDRPSLCCLPSRRPSPLEDEARGRAEESAEAAGPAGRDAAAPPTTGAVPGAAPAPATPAPESPDVYTARPDARAQAKRSYPGTGWGTRLDDPVVVVSFEAESAPAETLTLRYEYAPALRALGIRLGPDLARDRLRERERGEGGFAVPPPR
jgi:hypothetical protein